MNGFFHQLDAPVSAYSKISYHDTHVGLILRIGGYRFHFPER
jgi:hypothetical protein